ncbi:MAG: hypothetical protein ACYC0V_16260, partial [Armatimonadota bacterium]
MFFSTEETAAIIGVRLRSWQEYMGGTMSNNLYITLAVFAIQIFAITGAWSDAEQSGDASSPDISFSVKSVHVKRSFTLTNSGLVTTSFTDRASRVELIAVPAKGEGSVAINGQTYALGASIGHAFRYAGHTTTRIMKGGQRLEVMFAAPKDL